MKDVLLEQIYTEGLWDRMKAKQAGRNAEKAAGVGMGTKIAGAGANLLNKATGGNLGGTSKLKKTLDRGSVAKSSAQVNAISQSYMAKLKDIANKYAMDIKKLNVDVSMIDDEQVRNIITSLIKYVPPQV